MSAKRAARYMMQVILTIPLMTGCGFVDRLLPAPQERPAEDAGLLILQQGNDAVREQKYLEAEEIFNDLSQMDGNESVRRQALYGLACVRLITAETREEAEAALELWDTWAAEFPTLPEFEDPRLLRPFLVPKIENQKGGSDPSSEASKRKISAGSKSGGRLKIEIQRLQDLVKALETENRTLKHQLQSLEAIDQNMQKKKEKIDSPQSEYIEIPKP